MLIYTLGNLNLDNENLISENGKAVRTIGIATCNYIYPDSEIGLTSTTSNNVAKDPEDYMYEKPDKVEFSVDEENGWWVFAEKYKHPDYIPVKTGNIKFKNNKSRTQIMTDELINENDYDIRDVFIYILYKDKNGKLKGGESTDIYEMKAGENKKFKTSGYPFKYKNYVIYTEPW